MLNHLFHRAVLQELSIPVAVHTVIFILTSIGIRTEQLVSQRHATALTKFHLVIHIRYFLN
jgi:hypothetical protein